MSDLEVSRPVTNAAKAEQSRIGRLQLAVSALVGGTFSILVDLATKEKAAAVLVIGQKLEAIFEIDRAPLFAALLILALGVAICFVFDVRNKRIALYYGASVLALIMTGIPYKLPPGLTRGGNSVEVNLSISTQDRNPVANAIITLLNNNGEIVAQSRISGSTLTFLQAEGQYQIVVEMPGYEIGQTSLNLQEGSGSIALDVILRPSGVPLFLQRLVR